MAEVTRFQVLTVTGWPIRPHQRSAYRRTPEGLSATVYDSVYDREIVTYRSDEPGVNGVASRRQKRTLERAREHAARLEAEYSA